MDEPYVAKTDYPLKNGQTTLNEEGNSPDDVFEQRLAHLIAENQYLQQQLKQNQSREQNLIKENISLQQNYQRLREQTTFLETLLQQVADGILIVSGQEKIHFANQAASYLFGRSVEELQGYYIGSPISNGITEIELHRPDQTHIIAQLRVSEITWEKHKAYLVSLRDITKEKQTQSKLEESEQRFRLLANTAPVLIWMTNAQGKLLFVNDAWLQLTGQKNLKFIGSKWLKMLHPDDLSDYWSTFQEAMAKQTGFQIQFRLKHPQKGYQWLLNRGIPRLTSEGEFLGFIGSCTNINQHKLLEEQLLKVTQAVDCSGEAIAIFNAQETCIYQNTAFTELFNHPFAEINQISQFSHLLSKKESAYLSQIIDNIRQGQASWRGELSLKRIKGQKQQISLQIDRINHSDDLLIGLVMTAIDVTQQKQVETQLKQTNRQLKASVQQLATTNREIAQLSTMVELLQGCFYIDEAYQVLKQQIPRLFADFSGSFFILDPQKQTLDTLVTWGEDNNSATTFNLYDCWGLRRGSLHWSLDPNYLTCPHQHADAECSLETLCVPVSARGETFGSLYLCVEQKKNPQLGENQHQFCNMVAEHIGMALANLKLQEKLKQESIRDPLTHLYNRRYLEESLEQEISRSQRKSTALSLIMIDIDYFKKINDDYGHAAGDLVLKKLGSFLQKNIRGSDIACRFGGEELTLIFPETTLEQACYRAEQLRIAIKEMKIEFQHQLLRPVTVSLGIASFPEYGKTGQDILHIADLALYRAKESGRDCIVTADVIFNH